MNNYVPYGDFPAGSSNGAESSNASNGEWRNNYVAYQEGGGDDEVDKERK